MVFFIFHFTAIVKGVIELKCGMFEKMKARIFNGVILLRLLAFKAGIFLSTTLPCWCIVMNMPVDLALAA